MLRVIAIGGITGAVLVAAIFAWFAIAASGVIMGGPGISNEKLLVVVLVGIAVGLLSGVAVGGVIAVLAKDTNGWLVGLITGFFIGGVGSMLLTYFAQSPDARQHSPILSREMLLGGLISSLCCAGVGFLLGAVVDSLFKISRR